MSPTARALVAPPATPSDRRRRPPEADAGGRGFGAGGRREKAPAQGKGRKRRGSGLSAADRSPLGRSPDLAALEARARLGLALAGRLSEGDVNRAWKRAASEHHPDRGGLHDTMQAINAARDLLLGRGIET
ncbi:molecular chaperone DnaJ [Cyanobium sp. FGCU-6]|jgi:hypothetical protein|nr:molecular chaperone DnaJ [Cyanobium sp. FGCU6]